jgi:hypothetical protein
MRHTARVTRKRDESRLSNDMLAPQTELLQTNIGGIFDKDVAELINELTEVREGRLHDPIQTRLLDFLTVCFLSLDQTKFVPVKPRELVVCHILTSKVDQLKESQIQNLLLELVLIAHSHQDNHGHQKLYVALNTLMKPICLSLRKKKNQKYPNRPM